MKWRWWQTGITLVSTSALLAPVVILSAAANGIEIDGKQNEQLGSKSGWYYQDHYEQLILSVVQFSDNQFIKQPLLSTNLNFATWYKNYFLDLNLKNLDPYGTKATLNLVYYDEQSGQKKAINATLINLFPEIIWKQNAEFDVSKNLLGGLQTTSEFLANPVANLLKLIQFDQLTSGALEPQWLASTNLSLQDLNNLKVAYHFGQPDPFKGQILNNEISFLVPTINNGNPQWDQNDHYERYHWKFDLINFLPLKPSYVFNLDQELNLDPQGAIANLGVQNFDQNQFFNFMVNYQSNYLKTDQLIATNLDQATFSKQISHFQIQVLNDNQAIVRFQLDQKQLGWKINGFKIPISIDQNQKMVANVNQYQWLNDWVDPFLNRDLAMLKNLVGSNLANIFYDLLNLKDIDGGNINQLVDRYELQIFPTLGSLEVQLLLNPDGNVIINGSQNQALKIYFQLNENRGQIDRHLHIPLLDEEGYDWLDDFVNNFINFAPEENRYRLDAMWTNLTKDEFLAITSISIDRDPKNRLGLVRLQINWLDRPQENWEFKIISNRRPIWSQFSDEIKSYRFRDFLGDLSVDDINEQTVFDLIDFNNQSSDDYGIQVATSRHFFTNVLWIDTKFYRGWNDVGVEISFYDRNAINDVQSYYFTISELKPSLKWIALITGLSLATIIVSLIIYGMVKISHQQVIKAKIKQKQQYLRSFEDGQK